MTGQSIATLQNPINQSIPVYASTPTQQFFGSDNVSQPTLQYPLDLQKYFMSFSISQYNRNSLTSIGTFKDANYPGIIMPLPGNMIDMNHVDWHEVELGMLPGAILTGLQQNPGATALVGASALGVAALAGKGLSTLTQKAPGVAQFLGNVAGASGGLAGAAVQAAEVSYGASPNQFVTMLFRGPTYKRHRFEWQLSPNNQQEAQNLTNIITSFKNAMAPNFYNTGLGLGPVLWNFPKIFRIRFYPNSDWMYKFKPCVCDSFAVNYAPMGRAAFNVDTTGAGTQNAPQSVTIQATFIELEYWIEGNYGGDGSNNPDVTASVKDDNSPETLLQTFNGDIIQQQALDVAGQVPANPTASPNIE